METWAEPGAPSDALLAWQATKELMHLRWPGLGLSKSHWELLELEW
jgi:hypothetical protein